MLQPAKLKKILCAIMVVILAISMLSLTACKKKEPIQGEQGIPGEKGDKGEKGENGITPHIGANGNWWIGTLDTGITAAGRDGANGAPGINGDNGLTPSFKFEENEKILYVSYDNGDTWRAMIDLNGLCVNGQDGKNGTDGKDGKDGVDGEDGKDGKDGANGITPLLKISATDNIWMVSYDNGASWQSLGIVATGKDGVDGEDGKDGKDGADGKNGIDGNDGKNGVDGIDGNTPKLRINSDYMWEVSYDEGVSWISLGVRAKGDTGEAGKDGVNGTNGTDGQNGKDGTTPRLQFDDNKIYVSYDNWVTKIILLDMASVTVNGGANGENGKDGITPQIGISTDGFWQVSYDNGATWKSLGVSAIGKDGLDGSAGSSGADGTNGKDGVDGVTPKLKIESNVWMVSYDNGVTWESLGANASGTDGSNGNDGRGIKSMEIKDGYLYVTYTDSIEPVKLGAVGTVGGSGSAPEDSDYYTDGLAFYPLPDGTYGVKAGYTDYLEHVIIPAKYKGKAVTKILDEAFKGHENLQSIVIPASVTEIGVKAFADCQKLTNVSIPESVTVIKTEAFARCSSITSLYIHKGVNVIGFYAFYEIATIECEIAEANRPSTWEDLGCPDIRWNVPAKS